MIFNVKVTFDEFNDLLKSKSEASYFIGHIVVSNLVGFLLEYGKHTQFRNDYYEYFANMFNSFDYFNYQKKSKKKKS